MSNDSNPPKEYATQIASGRRQAEPVPMDTDDARTGLLKHRSTNSIAFLTIIEGPGTDQKLSVSEGRNTIGRSETNDIVLNYGDPTVSRETHALITIDLTNAEMRIYDGGKSNPVLLNGRAVVGSQPIKLGDTVVVGNTRMKFGKI